MLGPRPTPGGAVRLEPMRTPSLAGSGWRGLRLAGQRSRSGCCASGSGRCTRSQGTERSRSRGVPAPLHARRASPKSRIVLLGRLACRQRCVPSAARSPSQVHASTRHRELQIVHAFHQRASMSCRRVAPPPTYRWQSRYGRHTPPAVERSGPM